MMRRRGLIMGLGSAVASSAIWPRAARAQRGERVRRIGILVGVVGDFPTFQALLGPFRDGLSKLGWAEGRNLRIDLRVDDSDDDRIRADAAEW